MDFQRKTIPFLHNGMNWNLPVEKLPDGQYPWCKNVRVVEKGTISSSHGHTPLFVVDNAAYVHSISRLNILSEQDNQQRVFYAFDPVRGKGQQLAVSPESVESPWAISPDGSRIAIPLPQGSQTQIRILSLTGGAPKYVLVSGWSAFQSIVWAADGKGWYAATRSAATNTLLFVDPDGHATALRQIPGGYYTWAIPSPDGHHVAFLEYTNTNNVWMVENF